MYPTSIYFGPESCPYISAYLGAKVDALWAHGPVGFGLQSEGFGAYFMGLSNHYFTSVVTRSTTTTALMLHMQRTSRRRVMTAKTNNGVAKGF